MRIRTILMSLAFTVGSTVVGIGCDYVPPSAAPTSGPGGMGGGGSGGSGGSGGIGGNGGVGGGGSVEVGGSGTGSTGVGGGGLIGMPCKNDANDCGFGLYCAAPACGAGTCQLIPPGGSPMPMFVCGCDGITYWNAEWAAAHGASVKSEGQCAPTEAMACATLNPCPKGTRCNRVVDQSSACMPQATGVCWGIPPTCSGVGPKGNACTNGACVDQCSLIQSENPWYHEGNCL